MKFTKFVKKSAIPVAISISFNLGFAQDLIQVTADTDVLSTPVGVSKTDTALIDVPSTVNVFSAEQVTDQAIDSIGQIVDYTPGVNNSQGEGHRDAVVFRGQDRGTANFFIDGVRDDVQYYRSLYNVEQTEIALGANALFFGRGSAGGAINRVLKKAQIGEDFTTYEVGADSFGGFDGKIDYNYTANDNLAFRFNVFAESLANHRDLFEGDRVAINPTITYALSDDTQFYFSYEYVNYSRFIDRGIPSLDGAPAEELSRTTFGDPDLNVTDTLGHTLNFTVNHRINDFWKARGTVAYTDFEKTYQNFFPTAFDGTDVTIDGYLDGTDRQSFTLYGDLVGEFTTGFADHKLLVGAEFINTESDQFRFNAQFEPDDNADGDTEVFTANNFRLSGGGGTNTSGNFTIASFTPASINDDTSVSLNTYSIFIQDEISLNDYVDVVLGARYDSFDIDVEDNAFGTGSGSNSEGQISPRIGIVVKPTQDFSLYASFSETFLPRSGEQFANLGNELDADEFTNLEAGVKWNIKPGLSFTASVYQIEQTVLEEIGTTDTFNDIETTTNGVEVSLKGQLTDNWYISAGYAFLDGEVSSGANEGNTPREQPEHSFSIWNNYQFTDSFGAGLGVIYQDSSFANSDNEVELPSFVRVDAALYYTLNENFRFQLNIENLFDTDYFPSAHSNDNITVGAPINARIGVVGKF